jgi:hypothetical protein
LGQNTLLELVAIYDTVLSRKKNTFQKFCYITTWSRVLLEKLTFTHLVKKFPALYGKKFITVFTTARHCPYPELLS